MNSEYFTDPVRHFPVLMLFLCRTIRKQKMHMYSEIGEYYEISTDELAHLSTLQG